MINIVGCSLSLAQTCVPTPWLNSLHRESALVTDWALALSKLGDSYFQASYALESRKSDADHLCLLL